MYAISGALAGLAGLIEAARLGASDASKVGLNIELDAIAAVVVGGTLLTGGSGNYHRHRPWHADHAGHYDQPQHASNSLRVVSRTQGSRNSRGHLYPGPEAFMREARVQDFIVSLIRRRGALVGLVLLLVLGAIRYEAFLTPENLLNVVRQNSMVGLVALGMTFVILTGGIDLSVGSLAALAGVAAASVSTHGVLAALAAGLLCSTVLGLANGLLISKARIPPFLTTLAVMMGVRGAVLAWTSGQSLRLNRASTGFHWLGRGHVGPIPVSHPRTCDLLRGRLALTRTYCIRQACLFSRGQRSSGTSHGLKH